MWWFFSKYFMTGKIAWCCNLPGDHEDDRSSVKGGYSENCLNSSQLISRRQIHRLACNRKRATHIGKKVVAESRIHCSGQEATVPARRLKPRLTATDGSFWIQSSGSCSCWTYRPETQGRESSGRDWRAWSPRAGAQDVWQDGTHSLGLMGSQPGSPGCGRGPAGGGWESRGQCCRPGCWGRRSPQEEPEWRRWSWREPGRGEVSRAAVVDIFIRWCEFQCEWLEDSEVASPPRLECFSLFSAMSVRLMKSPFSCL